MVTGYLAGLDGSICGKRAIAAMIGFVAVEYEMRCHNSMGKLDMKLLYVYVVCIYKFGRLIAACRRPVAGE